MKRIASIFQDSILPAVFVVVEILGMANPLFGQTPDTTGTIQFVLSGGETLYSLAAKLLLTADSLSNLNPELPGKLRKGDVIRVPADRASRQIKVQPGQTLFAISRRYEVSMEALKNANNMSGSSLRAGQTLIIPGQGVSADTASLFSGSTASNITNLKIIESGVAVVYPATYIGRMTASGSAYRPDRFVISHPDLGIGSIVLVSSPETGAETFAEIADRGFRGDPQIIDVSDAVARQLRLVDADDKKIEIRAVEMIEN